MSGGQRRHVDLFTGLGGFSLAAKWNGVKTVCQVEIDKHCRAFLDRAWPDTEKHDDIRTFDGAKYAGAWLLTAGVPCQPASRAGQQRGAADDRWLWPAALSALAAVRPAWSLFENPPGIGDVGLAGILSDVEALGYEVRVFGVPACAVGSPQRRERYWIVAHTTRDTQGGIQAPTGAVRERVGTPVEGHLADGAVSRHEGPDAEPGAEHHQGDVADAGLVDGRRRPPEQDAGPNIPGGREQAADDTERIGDVADAASGRPDQSQSPASDQDGQTNAESATFGQLSSGIEGRRQTWSGFVWLPCADLKVRRAPDDSFGLVDGLHRSVLAALGNSIVPQVAAEIVAAMIEAEDGIEYRNGG